MKPRKKLVSNRMAILMKSKTRAVSKERQFLVTILISCCGTPSTVRVLTVVAKRKRDAVDLAWAIKNRLEPQQIMRISASDTDEIDDVEILRVYDHRSGSARHAWTRAEIDSEAFEELVEQRATELEAGS
jgi:hypothetical protein